MAYLSSPPAERYYVEDVYTLLEIDENRDNPYFIKKVTPEHQSRLGYSGGIPDDFDNMFDTVFYTPETLTSLGSLRSYAYDNGYAHAYISGSKGTRVTSGNGHWLQSDDRDYWFINKSSIHGYVWFFHQVSDIQYFWTHSNSSYDLEFDNCSVFFDYKKSVSNYISQEVYDCVKNQFVLECSSLQNESKFNKDIAQNLLNEKNDFYISNCKCCLSFLNFNPIVKFLGGE